MTTDRFVSGVFLAVEFASFGGIIGSMYRNDMEAALMFAVTACYGAIKRLGVS